MESQGLIKGACCDILLLPSSLSSGDLLVLICSKSIIHPAYVLWDPNIPLISYLLLQFSSFAVMSDSLWPHGLQHARLLCPSPTPGACSNSRPSSQWCHPTISSSVILFSSCLQSFPASGCFPMSKFFTLGGQSIGASASASVLPMNIQDWFPLGLISLISLQPKGLKSLLQHHSSEASIPWHSAFFIVQLSHPYIITIIDLIWDCISVFYHRLSRLFGNVRNNLLKQTT